MVYEALLLTPNLVTTQPSILAGIAKLHASCILIDGTLATFVPPLDIEVLIEWWEVRWAESQRGERAIIVVLSDPSDTSIDNNLTQTSDEAVNAITSSVAGVVTLFTPFSQTGPFRAVVEKFFVSPSHRRLGLGRKLMAKLESVALENGRTNILLDTTVGTPAEKVYPRFGYRRMGVVERNGINPLTRELVDEVWFWKDLSVDPALQETEN